MSANIDLLQVLEAGLAPTDGSAIAPAVDATVS